MTRSGRSGSHGRRGGEHGGCDRGREQNYTGTRMVAKSGLCAALGNNVFDYGHRAAADQMQTSWEKLNLYSSWVQTTDRTSAMSYRIRSLRHLPNQSILYKSWQGMPFENRWFTPDKRTYNRPSYQSKSCWKLQLHLE
jgi:hypothetical protein